MSTACPRPAAWLAAIITALAFGGAAPSFGAGVTPAAPAPHAAKAGHDRARAHRGPPKEPPANVPPRAGAGGQAKQPAANDETDEKPVPAAKPQPVQEVQPEQETKAPAPKNLEPIPPGVAVPILGRKVEGPDQEDMGRVVDVLVDGTGAPRAAVIDFGGFLGVGSRKIAVDWALLHFNPTDPDAPIALSLARDQVQAAPEYLRSEPKASVVGPPKNAPTPAAILVPTKQPPTEPPATLAPSAKPAAPPTETPSPSEAPPKKR
jgi:hypothetical protein